MSEFCTIKSKEIVNGSKMMHSNDNLVTWESDLDVLENGDLMFYHCDALDTFKAKTPNLKRGYRMFSAIQNSTNNSNHATIKLDLDNLENGEEMFYYSRAVLIPNRDIANGWQLPKLENGRTMFSNSSVNVAANENSSWASPGYFYFPALVNAEYMFYRCSSVDSFDNNFTNITNCHEMFRLSSITDYVHTNLLPNGPVVNSEIAYLEESSNYRLAQDSGCNVCMSGMFRECSNLQYAYLSVSSRVDTRIYAPQMFYASMSNGGKVHLRYEFEYCVLSADEMFRGCRFSSFTTTSGHNFPQLRSARSMFHHSYIGPSLVINSMPVVEDTTLFACGCSNLRHASLNAKTIGYGAFANCIKLDSAYLHLGNGTHDFSFLFSGSMGGSGYTILSSVELYENNNGQIVSDIQSCYCMFAGCPYLSSASVSNYISFANVANAAGMFNYCYMANYNTIGSFTGSFSENLSNATNMFYYCNALESMPLTYNQMKNIETGNYMFYQCVAMNGTFSNFNDTFTNLSNANSMFEGCGNVNGYWKSDLPVLNEANRMFTYTGIERFGDTDQTIEMPNVTNTNEMFYGCFDLEYCYLSMPNVKTARDMFDGSSLHHVSSLSMPKLTDSYRMFYACSALSYVHLENVTNITSCSEMFAGDEMLRTVLLSYPSVASGTVYYKWGNCSRMFAGCGDLTIRADNHNAFIFKNATNCERMFACDAWYDSSSMSPNYYPSLKFEGICIDSSVMTNISNMFDGRRIKDTYTAELIGRVTHYTTLSSSQSMGSIFIDEPSYLDDLDKWTAWSRSEAEEVSGKSYSKIELSMSKGSAAIISLTVYCDTEKYNQYLTTPYDIVEGSAYIPDASSWNADFASGGLVVTSVHDGYAWAEV